MKDSVAKKKFINLSIRSFFNPSSGIPWTLGVVETIKRTQGSPGHGPSMADLAGFGCPVRG